jgi:hypothetical protein
MTIFFHTVKWRQISSSNGKVVRIFLSYGHHDYTSLALRLKRDLESGCHLSTE